MEEEREKKMNIDHTTIDFGSVEEDANIQNLNFFDSTQYNAQNENG